jgi:hypothetical protein
MQAYLVRIGVDQAYGGWNAPVNPQSNEFVYVPIPESRPMSRALETPYTSIRIALAAFEASHPGVASRYVTLPQRLISSNMHLDPDFDHLTYGDSGTRRGRRLTELATDDIVVFYAGLKPIAPCPHLLVYGLVGLYHVAEAVRVASVPSIRWSENAHTRCVDREGSDVIVRAQPGSSGRLKRCIPIGEFRGLAYRVRRDILDEWGGLSCRDGYLQRSAVLPTLLDPRLFMRWFDRQCPELVNANNPSTNSS